MIDRSNHNCGRCGTYYTSQLHLLSLKRQSSLRCCKPGLVFAEVVQMQISDFRLSFLTQPQLTISD